MAKKYFLSFADSRFCGDLIRIKRQALDMGIFDGIFICDENSFDREFCYKFRENLKMGSRGFGYWVWKPYITGKIFDLLEDGDILCYCDVGCHLNLGGKRRFLEYFQMLESSQKHLLAFQSPEGKGLEEGVWTKGDLLDYFNVRGDNSILHSPQIVATTFLAKKDRSILDFLSKWLEVYYKDFSLATDAPSRSENLPEFREHRHDQSIFSILIKKTNYALLISHSENYPENRIGGKPNWDSMASYPIWAMRDKTPRRFWLIVATIKILKRIKWIIPSASLRKRIDSIKVK